MFCAASVEGTGGAKPLKTASFWSDIMTVVALVTSVPVRCTCRGGCDQTLEQGMDDEPCNIVSINDSQMDDGRLNPLHAHLSLRSVEAGHSARATTKQWSLQSSESPAVVSSPHMLLVEAMEAALARQGRRQAG